MLSFNAMSLNGDPQILGLLYIPMLFGVRKLVMLVLRRQMGKVSGAVPTNADAEADAISTAPARTKVQFQRFEESARGCVCLFLLRVLRASVVNLAFV